MFALVDCNNFYASCERVFRPDLIGKPIVVLSNNDGCVIARSSEAKALHVPMGAPAFKYEAFFRKNKINVFSSNYALYGDMSNRVMSLLRKYTPDVEVYSIDEAFLKLNLLDSYNLQDFGNEIRQKVTKGTGIPISIGIGPTKVLSKLANKIAKKYPNETGGVYVIDDDEKRLKALKWATIDDVWGIGRGLSKKMKLRNIKTAYDFTQLEDSYVYQSFSITEFNLKKELEGVSKFELEEVKSKKAISTTRTFENMLTDFDEILERLFTFASSCAEKLRKEKGTCNLVYVFLRTNRHRKDLKTYRNGLVLRLEHPTSSTMDILPKVRKALRTIYKVGYHYKRAGVILMGIVPDDQRQTDLFYVEDEKQKALMKVVDTINSKFDDQKLKIASQDLKRTWKMKQNSLSPRYTTKFEDILIVKA